MKRILLDCTYTKMKYNPTGIPRVVREFARYFPQNSKDKEWVCIPIFFSYSVNPFFSKHKMYLLSTFPLKNVLGYFFGKLGLTGMFLRLHSLFYRFCCPFLKPLADFTEEDVLVFPEQMRRMVDKQQSIIALAKKNGAKVGFVIHDILPITHPEFFSETHSIAYKGWIDTVVIPHTDFIIGVSKTTCLEFQKYKDTYFYNSPVIRLSHSYLGYNFSYKEAPLRACFSETFFKDKNTKYISVGSISNRKNYGFILDAFEKIWQTQTDFSLYIVGGAHSPQLVSRLKNHPQLNQNLFCFFDLTDSELSFLYRHCDVFISASKMEGFGLPVVEALGYGLPVLASDISVYTEIGNSFCLFFSLNSVEDLIKKIFIAKYENKSELKKKNWINWEEATQNFVKQVIELSSYN